MLFSSVEFLGVFLPLFLLASWLLPRLRNGVLFVFSLIFYAYGEPVYVLLMLVTIAVNYALGLWTAQRGRLPLALAVVFDLAMLGFFKYYDLFATAASLPLLHIPLPVGISFYTFQALSYVIDVYRGTRPQKNFVSFGTYITMFPQLIAGPIVRYDDIAHELTDRRRSATEAASGIFRFVIGLSKKLLLANPAGQMWEYYRTAERSVFGAWLGLVFYAFQIYFDFSAYSDMAIGLGKILGFRFPENFNYPYCAVSIQDFWRRWHISLSTWFREYVYIPLGGNRRGQKRTVLHLLVVWSLTGLWHGASLNFLLWGIYYFCLLTAEKLFLGRWIEKLPRPLRHAYALFFILLGWLLFAFEDTGALVSYASSLLPLSGAALIAPMDRYEFLRNLGLLICLAVGSTPRPARAIHKFSDRRGARPVLLVGSLALFALSLSGIAAGGYNPFLYFRF